MGHLGGGSERDVCIGTLYATTDVEPLVFQIAMLSKIQLPLWLAYTVIYSFVHPLLSIIDSNGNVKRLGRL